MNSQEALQDSLATTRNEALAHAWGCAATYRAEAMIQKARADTLQAELDKIKAEKEAKSVPEVKAAKK